MKMKCTRCPGQCTVDLGQEAPTVAAIQAAAPDWSLANILTQKDGTVVVNQLQCWCPCCKTSQNCNG